jgi:hypothetical protein
LKKLYWGLGRIAWRQFRESIAMAAKETPGTQGEFFVGNVLVFVREFRDEG